MHSGTGVITFVEMHKLICFLGLVFMTCNLKLDEISMG